MATKELYTKACGGSLYGEMIMATHIYYYEENPFKFKHSSIIFDGGDTAMNKGGYTIESIIDFLKSKGKTTLIPINH